MTLQASSKTESENDSTAASLTLLFLFFGGIIMILKNAAVWDDNFTPCKTDIIIDGEKITSVGKTEFDGIDCSGKVIVPGFIDIHIHGCNMADVTDGKPDSVLKMSSYLASKGITSFCPTTMTISADELEASFRYAADAMGKESGAYIHGINMEGPFISPAKKGAQAEEYILPPDIGLLKKLNGICPVRLVDIAPEEKGSEEFIVEVKKICTVSAAHTNCNYDQAKKAFSQGISHATHLYNAMNGLGSRAPGAVGAVFDTEGVNAELICDGIHIHPAMLRLAFKQLGENRTIVISDSMMAAGLPDGEYTLGGQKVIKKGAARLEDGTLAGSVTNLFEEFNNLLSFGIPVSHALRSVTINPARAIGADKITGSIAPGKNADLLILSEDFSQIHNVIIKGKTII